MIKGRKYVHEHVIHVHVLVSVRGYMYSQENAHV